jgi:hypothetical protein
MAAGPLKSHVDSFVLTLRAVGRSERTATMYSEAVRWFAVEHLLVPCLLLCVSFQAKTDELRDPGT